MAYLRHWINGNTVSTYNLNESLVIGRSQDCHIQLDDGTVSGEHAKIYASDDYYIAEDLNSTNGISVNGKKAASIRLAQGDILTVGIHEFEFLLEAPSDYDRTQRIKKSWIPGVYYTD